MILSEAPTIHPTATVEGCTPGRWTGIGKSCSALRVAMNDHFYVGGGGQAIDTVVGNADIAAATRINPNDHPTRRVTLHRFTYRSADCFEGAAHDDVFAWRRSTPVTIGHDVWIGPGAVHRSGVTVHDGALSAEAFPEHASERYG